MVSKMSFPDIVAGCAHRRVEILTEGDGCSDDGTQVKDSPENTDILALLVLSRICQHQGALSGP